MTDNAYFERISENRFRPNEQAGGAWSAKEIHFSPLGGLIAHEIDRYRSGSTGPSQLARISFDILGFLAAEVCEVSVRTIRPGRTIEVVEAIVRIGGRDAVLARAWFLAPHDTSEVAGGGAAQLVSPEDLEPAPLTDIWIGGYISSLEVRTVGPRGQGRTTAWLRSETDIVAGEESTPWARFVALVDTANGIAVRQKPTEWMFPNVDLTIHFFRSPVGPWVGLDTTVAFGPTGLGVTSSALHDESGQVGRSEQALTVRDLTR